MRTTLNISDSVIRETEALYGSSSRSGSVESALKDAIKFKKLQNLMSLKGKIEFDGEYLEEQRRIELNEQENNR